MCSFFLSIKWRTCRCQHRFETVSRSRSRVSSSRGHWYTYACTLTESKSLIYTRMFEGNEEPWLHFRGTWTASQSTFKGPTVFPILSKSSYISIYSTRIHSASECKDTFNTYVLLRLSKLDGKPVFICDFFIIYLMFYYQI